MKEMWGIWGQTPNSCTSEFGVCPQISHISNLQLEHANAVILAVANVDRPALNKHAVRTSEFACERTAFRAIASLSVAHHSRNSAAVKVDAPNDVILRIGNVETLVGGVRDAFRTI